MLSRYPVWKTKIVTLEEATSPYHTACNVQMILTQVCLSQLLAYIAQSNLYATMCSYSNSATPFPCNNVLTGTASLLLLDGWDPEE